MSVGFVLSRQIVGFFAVTHGAEAELDDPEKSSGGENPDAIFNFRGKRISVACKTLRSANPATILGNIASAAKQITKSKCDDGYILFNGMNIIEHNKLENRIFSSVEEPFSILKLGLEQIYHAVIVDSSSELSEIFQTNPKVSPVVITAVHSATRIHSNIGVLSTSLKGTVITNLKNQEDYEEPLVQFPCALNEFIHNRATDA